MAMYYKNTEKFSKTSTSLNEFFKKKVKENPNSKFIKFLNREYTWLDIDRLSCIVALDLYDIGVRANSHIALLMPNSIDWVVTFFAICKLGAVPALLNSESSAREVAVASNVADIEYVCYSSLSNNIVEDDFKANIFNESGNKIKHFYQTDIKKIEKRINECNAVRNLYINTRKEGIELLLFTSGSTGKPKAVMHNIGSAINCAKHHVERMGLNAVDRHCLVLPLFHIFGLYSVLLSAAVSDGVIIIPDNLKTSIIIETIKKEKCTTINAVPTLLIAILSNDKYMKEDLKSLKSTIVGGSYATPAQINMFKEQMPNNNIMVAYGLTEAYPVTMTKNNDSIEHLTQTVGSLYQEIDIKIQDPISHAECKKNETGEILIKGYSVMAGYYNDSKPELAIDDGWLHTGDLAYITDDGYCCLNGRIKEVIIRSGENIMPLEIASSITKIEGIKDAKVIGVFDEFRGEEIAACITLNEGYRFDEANVRKILLKNLSKHKIPKYIFVYDELPKLGTGKVDSKKLKYEIEMKINQNI